jgi:hypothetical protein
MRQPYAHDGDKSGGVPSEPMMDPSNAANTWAETG